MNNKQFIIMNIFGHITFGNYYKKKYIYTQKVYTLFVCVDINFLCNDIEKIEMALRLIEFFSDGYKEL